MEKIEIIPYTTDAGKQPFFDWHRKLDVKVKSIIMARFARLRRGNFGDCKSIVGARGLFELRIDYGSGYRIYYGKVGTTIVVLLVGGDKSSQDRDIVKAKKYWLDFKEQNDG